MTEPRGVGSGPRKLVVIGTGGHAAVVVDLARLAGLELVGCVGPEPPGFDESFCPYLGADDRLPMFANSETGFAVGVGSVGDPSLRARLFNEAVDVGLKPVELIHPSAIVADTALFGLGAQVLAGAIVQPFAKVGLNAVFYSGAIVEHHAQIGDHVFVAPGAVICGGVRIGDLSHIGAGATVLQTVAIGARALVRAGSVAQRDVSDDERLASSEARP